MDGREGKRLYSQYNFPGWILFLSGVIFPIIFHWRKLIFTRENEISRLVEGFFTCCIKFSRKERLNFHGKTYFFLEKTQRTLKLISNFKNSSKLSHHSLDLNIS